MNLRSFGRRARVVFVLVLTLVLWRLLQGRGRRIPPKTSKVDESHYTTTTAYMCVKCEEKRRKWVYYEQEENIYILYTNTASKKQPRGHKSPCFFSEEEENNHNDDQYTFTTYTLTPVLTTACQLLLLPFFGKSIK